VCPSHSHLQDKEGQALGEADERSQQPDPDTTPASDHNYLPEVDTKKKLLMSMFLPSDATHKRFGFIFSDTTKVVWFKSYISWTKKGH